MSRSGDTWIEANYKETDLANMYVGQPAEIKIDAYPGVHITGHVASIGAGLEVIEPLELRERLAELAAELVALYR